MSSTTHTEFDKNTEALTVARAFPGAIKNRTILITGVNKLGIGYAHAQAFASQAPSHLILAGRSEAKLEECALELKEQYPSVNLRKLIVDLGSMQSIRAAAKVVLGWDDIPAIDIIVNNAGLMRHGDTHPGTVPVSADGIEDMFATNHIGHFLLTNLIMSKVIAAAKQSPAGSTRIINVSSGGAWVSPFRPSDLEWKKSAKDLPEIERPNFAILKMAGMAVDENDDSTYIPTAAYGASKTCNVLFSVGLNQKLFDSYGILSLAINPGEIKTELARNTDKAFLESMVAKYAKMVEMHWKTFGQGAATSLVAACDPKLVLPAEDGTGQFLSDCQVTPGPPYAVSREIAQKLWDVSETLTGQRFDY